MAGALVCSGRLGLTGLNGAASPPGWSTFAPNLSNRRSIGVEAGLPANVATDLNNQSIRNLAGGAYVPSRSPINMGAFYNGPPTYAWQGLPNPINEAGGNTTYIFVIVTTKIANGATLNYSLGGPGAAAGQLVTPTSGSMTVNNNNAAFSIQVTADQTTDGAKLINITISRPSDGVAVLTGSITVNDTSLSKGATITSPAAGNLNESTAYTFNVSTTGYNNGEIVYWSAVGAATVLSGQFTTNGSSGSFSLTTGGTAQPNQLIGTYCGVQALQVANLSLTVYIRRDSSAGAILTQASYTVLDNAIGGTNTITWTQNTTPITGGRTINTAYNAAATAGFTRSGGPYRINLANNIQITIPAGIYTLGGLTINGTGNPNDRYFVTVNGGILGSGGTNGGSGGPGLSFQNLAGTVTVGGSGVIGGGGGAGGGQGRFGQSIGGRGAGTATTQPQSVGPNGTTVCQGARQGGGGGNYFTGSIPVGLGAWQPGGSTIGQGGGGGGGGGGAIWYDPGFTGTGAGNWKGGNGGTTGMGTNATFSNTVALGAGAAGGGGGGFGFAGTSGVARNATSAFATGGSAGSSIARNGYPVAGSVAIERGPRI